MPSKPACRERGGERPLAGTTGERRGAGLRCPRLSWEGGGVEAGEPPRAAAQRSQTDRDRQHRVSSLRVESEEKHKTKLTEQNGLGVPTGGWAGRNGGGA